MRPAREAAQRHDYARIWRTLKPAERDRRVAKALMLWTEGRTLAQVGATWRMTKSELSRALIAWAPMQYQQAKVARDFVRLEKAEVDLLRNPVNPDARARVHYCRWYLKHSLQNLDWLGLELWGREIKGPCVQCGTKGAVFVARNKAKCYACEWEGGCIRYLAATSRVVRLPQGSRLALNGSSLEA